VQTGAVTVSGSLDFGTGVGTSGSNIVIGAEETTVSGHTLAGNAYVFVPASTSACTSPTGKVGDVIYNSAKHVYQYCNGTNWVPMGPLSNNGGGAGCTSPTGNEADKIYNNTSGVLQYCDGTTWRQIGHHKN
jgi:hypothetical protein